MAQRVPDELARPWTEIVDVLRGETGLDDLAYEARRHGGPPALTGSHLSKIRKGSRPYSLELFEGLAGALGVAPEVFAEYRLLRVRRQLDERVVGLKQAIAALNELGELIALDAQAEADLEELRVQLEGEPSQPPPAADSRRGKRASTAS